MAGFSLQQFQRWQSSLGAVAGFVVEAEAKQLLGHSGRRPQLAVNKECGGSR